ncbi:MAG: hypothetical protein JWP97_3097 [Labilithrix sp.]|nr:hypothetical protein [Labilithrix sp.]
MRRLGPADYVIMPWKNGGGTTTELVREPASGERHRFRVSIADVTADGPFSRFDGYERFIMVLEGAGMTLEAGAQGTIALAPLVPRRFSGDWDVYGKLLAGPVKDFNLMVDRAHGTGSLEVVRVRREAAVSCAAGETCIVHVLAGALTDGARGETLLLDAPRRLTVHPDATGETVLAVARTVAR